MPHHPGPWSQIQDLFLIELGEGVFDLKDGRLSRISLKWPPRESKLEMVFRHVTEASIRVGCQRELIERLREGRHPTDNAEKLLDSFVKLQQMHEALLETVLRSASHSSPALFGQGAPTVGEPLACSALFGRVETENVMVHPKHAHLDPPRTARSEGQAPDKVGLVLFGHGQRRPFVRSGDRVAGVVDWAEQTVAKVATGSGAGLSRSRAIFKRLPLGKLAKVEITARNKLGPLVASTFLSCLIG